MRGKVHFLSFFILVYRITPAYAGKREWKSGKVSLVEDHPRLCGEKLALERLVVFKQGSPPPMRGKACKITQKRTRARITPAYAGKRAYVCSNIMLDGDHPRLCGEKILKMKTDNVILGSPPPMRGKVQQLPDCFRFFGITPAYAGKSRRRPPAEYPDRDHPRLCGEKQGSERETV